MMVRAVIVIAATAAPLGALAAPVTTNTGIDVSTVLDAVILRARQGGAAPPKFCQKIDPPPTVQETEARFNKFADAFLVKKDIDETFSYIDPGYINNGRATGAQAAYNFLKPLWASQQITVIRTLFRDNMSWLNYRSGVGTIVDRYRWEAGCIMEHWDSGEKMPAD